MSTSFKFLVIFITFSSITQADSLLTQDQVDVECAFRNSLCDLNLKRPCCHIRDVCMPSGPENLFRCTEKVGLGKFCYRDDECDEIQHAKCSKDKKCVCRAKNVQISEMLCRPQVGGFCWRNETCITNNSVCIDNECKCKNNYTLRFNDQCIFALIGMSCEEDSECSRLIPFSKCSKFKTCSCKKNYLAHNWTTCYPSTEINEKCIDNSVPCRKKNFVCINHFCQCKPNFVYKNSKCLPDRLYESCNSTFECDNIENAICSDDNICVCDKNYGAWDEKFCRPLLGVDCSTDKDCYAINSICIDKKCQCKKLFFKVSENLCLSQRLGETCFNQHDCATILNAECTENNVCECVPGYGQYNITTCAPLLGMDCSRDKLCAPVNSVCLLNHICVCEEGHQPETSTKCVSRHFKISCDRDDHCADIKYAECTNDNKCACKSDYVPLGNDKCVALLGHYCDDDMECISYNSVCFDHTCKCREKFLMQSEYQCDPISLGRVCERDRDCEVAIKNSRCSEEKICVCQNNYYAFNKVGFLSFECAPYLDERCISNDDCRFNFSACINNRCQCEPGFRSVSGNQCQKIQSLYTCKENIDCGDPWHNKCSGDKKCICNKNNTAINKFTCQPLLEGYCWVDHQCVTNYSKCVDYRCKCLQGFKAISDNFCVPVDNNL
ncbi:hypothetical protein KQX54_019051 [Cotesia glomerata]|uniref:EGF-like domain-containing protein n=1 Tax=Cotesia glomerata TaxID=32391 RepID=A0AAV7HYL1_COTGL|nr:hypothetical protein KQX54_019051 [Cotesia glomerata]